jgi:Glycosyltransferase family 87
MLNNRAVAAATPERRWILAAIVTLTVVWLGASKTPDFHVYWEAGRALRTGGWTAVYQITELASFKYHPVFAFACFPFGLLSENVARIVWALLNGLMVWDLMRRWRTLWHIDAAAIGIGFLCVGHALFWQFAYGNVAFVMLWLWTVALTSRSQWRVALCYAVLIALKPFWLALIVPWLLCRRFVLLTQVTAMIGALSIAPLILGVAGFTTAYQRWFATFADPSQGLNLQAHENQSWYGLLYRHGIHDNELKLLWLAGSALLGLMWLWHWRDTLRKPIEAAPMWVMELSILPFILWTAPLSWIHHQVLLWPLLALLWQTGRQSRRARVVCVASGVLLTGLSESIVGRSATLFVLAWGIPLLALLLLDWFGPALLLPSIRETS